MKISSVGQCFKVNQNLYNHTAVLNLEEKFVLLITNKLDFFLKDMLYKNLGIQILIS